MLKELTLKVTSLFSEETEPADEYHADTRQLEPVNEHCSCPVCSLSRPQWDEEPKLQAA